MNKIINGYFTPLTGTTNKVIIVGEPFEVWFEWEMKSNGKWKGNYYENDQNKPSVKQNWMVPVVVSDVPDKVLLWRVTKITMRILTDVALDPAYGNSTTWDSLYKVEWRVTKATDQNGNYPMPQLLAMPNPPAILPVSLNPAQQTSLIAEFWGKVDPIPEDLSTEVEDPEIVVERARKEKVDKILKQLGYKG